MISKFTRYLQKTKANENQCQFKTTQFGINESMKL